MRCIKCDLPIGEMPEDATSVELLCNGCYQRYENIFTLKDILNPLIDSFIENNEHIFIKLSDNLAETIYDDIQKSSNSFKDDCEDYDIKDIKQSFKNVISSMISKHFA